MYDYFIRFFSPELLSQAEYIDGVLYLPAYMFFEECLSLVGTLAVASITFMFIGVLGELTWIISFHLYRFFRSKIRKETKCCAGTSDS